MKNRKGYTLIELIAVIAIISVLVSLLLVGVGSVRHTVNVSSVRQEISQIESAIADFQASVGVTPPSQISLYESWSAGWDSDSISRGRIRGMFPSFDFRKDRDFNGDGDYNDFYVLKGDQCLVLFLGGLYREELVEGKLRGRLIGLSNNPTDPFEDSTGTRLGPFFRFDMDRVISRNDVPYLYFDDGVATGDCQPIFPTYQDDVTSRPRPYIYVSSYDGLGYRDSFPDNGSDANTYAAVADTGYGFRAYRRGRRVYWKPNAIQIISPGEDGWYGYGGLYLPDDDRPLPMTDLTPMPLSSTGPPTRYVEVDNITNFTSGELD